MEHRKVELMEHTKVKVDDLMENSDDIRPLSDGI